MAVDVTIRPLPRQIGDDKVTVSLSDGRKLEKYAQTEVAKASAA